MALFSTPKCPSCIRQLAGGAFQQIRGIKKMVKVPTVTVRLLKDVPKYGPAGMMVVQLPDVFIVGDLRF